LLIFSSAGPQLNLMSKDADYIFEFTV